MSSAHREHRARIPARGRAVRPGLLALVPLLVGLALPLPVLAHGKSVSYSTWRLNEGDATVRVRVSLLELTRLGLPVPLDPLRATAEQTDPVGLYLGDRLRLERGGLPCAPASPPLRRPSGEGWANYGWKLDCEASGPLRITSRVLLDEAPSHLHFARIVVPAAPSRDGDARRAARIEERVLTEASPSWTIGSTSASGDGDTAGGDEAASSLLDYLVLGIEHILTGWDHLAFVLALVLLARGLGEVARLVTGFTIAHSLTLGLAVLGWVRPAAAPVEALIGFSVALLAAENTWLLAGRTPAIPAACTGLLCLVAVLAGLGHAEVPLVALLGTALFCACHFGLLARTSDPTALRTLLAFAFGLIHGFGFAGILAEMALPTDRLVPALLGFNLGVEIGQLGVVVLLWPLLQASQGLADGRWHRPIVELTSAAVCGLGLFWFVGRSMGIG